MKIPNIPTSSDPSRRSGGPRHRSVLRTSIAPLAILLAVTAIPAGHAAIVLSPGDAIIGGRLQGTTFTVGSSGSTGNTWPTNEAPQYAIDGGTPKYLNFSGYGAGFMVTPLFDNSGGSVISSMQLWTANDSPDRDPASYQIWGTNSSLNPTAGVGTTFDTSNFTLISSGSLALPAGRNLASLDVANSQTVAFANTSGYKQYLVVFPTLKGATNSLMQIAEVQLSGVRSSDVLTWTGATNSTWNTSTSNWVTATGTPSAYHDATALTFGDTATNRAINIQNGGGGVQPASMTFVHNSGTYTFSGETIQSSGTLSLVGTGEVVLNNVANFTIGTVVNAGKLTVGAAGSLGSGPLTVNSQNAGGGGTSTVVLNSPHSIGALAGTVSATNSASLVLGGTLTINQTTTSDFQGVISGVGGLVKNGPAILNLTAPNTYQGPTVVNAGVLQSSRPNDETFSALPAGQPVTVNSAGTLLLGATDGLGYYEGSPSSLTINGGQVVAAANTHHTLPAVRMNGGTLTGLDGGHISSGVVVSYILDGAVITEGPATSYIKAAALRLRGNTSDFSGSSPITFTVPRGSGAADLVVSSKIQDTGAGLIKNGNGIMVLGNTSTGSGPTSVDAGTLRVANSTALGTGQVTLRAGSTLSLAPAGELNGFTEFTLNGGATLDANGTTATLTDNQPSEARSVYANIPLPVSNGFTASFVYQASGNRAADGLAFVIQSATPSALGAAGGGLGYQGLANSAGLLFNLYTTPGTNFTTGGVTGTGYTAAGAVAINSGNPILVTATYDPIRAVLTENLTDQTTLATYSREFANVNYLNALGGSTTGFIGFSGGTGQLAATQTISNFRFSVPVQTLTLANDFQVPASATVGVEVLPMRAGQTTTAEMQGQLVLNTGATLNVTGGAAATDSPYMLSVSGATSIGSGVTVNVANNGSGAGSVVLGDVSGLLPAAGLTKAGPGTLSILGSATYAGATIVNGGTLLVNGSISGATTVNAGATLTGVGTLGTVTINGDGILSPGSGLGGIATGPLFLKNGSTLSVEMNANNADIVLVGGAVNLAGTINLALSLNADPIDGTRFTLLDGSALVVGYNTGARLSYFGTPIDQGVKFEVPGNGFSQFFTIDYAANGGQDVVLTAVPEPGSGMALLGGLGALLGVRRRRR